jgi:hypothetical protein
MFIARPAAASRRCFGGRCSPAGIAAYIGVIGREPASGGMDGLADYAG